jgi:hypothetical protein
LGELDALSEVHSYNLGEIAEIIAVMQSEIDFVAQVDILTGLAHEVLDVYLQSASHLLKQCSASYQDCLHELNGLVLYVGEGSEDYASLELSVESIHPLWKTDALAEELRCYQNPSPLQILHSFSTFLDNFKISPNRQLQRKDIPIELVGYLNNKTTPIESTYSKDVKSQATVIS